jgi:hypothetical protein
MPAVLAVVMPTVRAVLVLLLTKDENHLFDEIPQRGNLTSIKKR